MPPPSIVLLEGNFYRIHVSGVLPPTGAKMACEFPPRRDHGIVARVFFLCPHN